MELLAVEQLRRLSAALRVRGAIARGHKSALGVTLRYQVVRRRAEGGRPSGGLALASLPVVPREGHQDRAADRADDAARPQREAVAGQQADDKAADERAEQSGNDCYRPVMQWPRVRSDSCAAAPTSMPNSTIPMMIMD